jgi:hypothetical protein
VEVPVERIVEVDKVVRVEVTRNPSTRQALNTIYVWTIYTIDALLCSDTFFTFGYLTTT